MKSTFAKQGFMPLLSALLLFVAFLSSTTSASAQKLNTPPDQKLNWKLEGEALTILENEIILWADGQTQGLFGPPGSGGWKNADNHMHYYKAILEGINNGASVYEAVKQGIVKLGDGVTTVGENLPANVLTVLQQDATELLTQ